MLTRISAKDPGWRRASRLWTRLPRLLAEARSRPARLALVAFGRVPLIRRLVAGAAALGTQPRTAAFSWAEALAGANPATVVGKLRAEGLVTGVRLPPDLAAQIRTYAEEHDCLGGPDWNLPFRPSEHAAAEERLGCKLVVGSVPYAYRQCSAVAALLHNRWLRAIAAGYLGPRARLIDVRLWWSFPSRAPGQRELGLAGQNAFHFDQGDWHQLKAFFYLTDVDQRSGPHVYVRGSHRERPLSHHVSPFSAKTDQQILAAYGSERAVTITGPAGTGFIEDPFGYHTGTLVQEGRRLVLELSFGITRTGRHHAYLGPD